MALAPPKHVASLFSLLVALAPATLLAQLGRGTPDAVTSSATAIQTPTPVPADSAPASQPSHSEHYWRAFAAGFLSSILLHEAGHIGVAYALGAHPYIGLNKGRPTIYSGIDSRTDPHKQFLFSSAGLNVQALLDEGILDVPHRKGSPFERGVLAGGIATAYFYATLGRNASVSDITFIARTSSLSKTQASLIYAGLATIHTIRIAHDRRYAHFFVRSSPVNAHKSPEASGSAPHALAPGMDVGVAILTATR